MPVGQCSPFYNHFLFQHPGKADIKCAQGFTMLIGYRTYHRDKSVTGRLIFAGVHEVVVHTFQKFFIRGFLISVRFIKDSFE